MKTLFLLLVTLGVYSLEALSAAETATPAKPNIIFIMADDLGYTDVACFGSKYYETPHIDRLAAQGMKLLSHHHCQNCTPTRAALMSGQYGARTGVYTVGGIERFDWSQRPLRPVDNVTDLPLDRAIIAKQLKQGGYATGMFGKWHIGQNGDYHPGKRGFDEAIVSMGAHFDFATSPQTDYPQGQYLADFLTDRAVDFIRRHKDHPFFLYLPHFAVHSPHDAKPELIKKFQTKPSVGGHNNPTYAAMIASVDESVGRVMQTLDELKLAQNTVLIFTSDNGGVGGYVREGIKKGGGDITDNAPLRSGKGSLYEGGTREPFVVRWPGVTKPGSTSEVPTIHVDLYPTFLELAGAPRPEHVLDGESQVSLFRDPRGKLQRDAIFQHFPGYLGAGPGFWRTTPVSLIQSGDWKLLEFLEDGRLELYNLRNDIGESQNLAKTMPDKTQELHARLVAWRAEVKAPMPTKNDGNAAAAKPNIVLIFIDDMGYGDIGPFGNTQVKTPQLDKFAAEGMKFTSFYATPVCSMSRACLMTGCYNARVSIPGVLFPGSQIGLHPDETTLAEVVKQRGYATICIGKWHLGHREPFLPTKQGFDSYFGIPYSNDMTIDPDHARFAKDCLFREGMTEEKARAAAVRHTVPLMRGEEVIEYPADQATLTQRYTAEAVKFIREHRSQPFFVYLPHTMVHAPLAASDRFRGQSGHGLLGDAVGEIDWSVGQIMQTLKDLQLDERTLVIFTSDNGAAAGSSAPWRGKKGGQFEGGVREPCMMRWPGKIPAATTCQQIAGNIDLLPTFAALVEAKLAEDRVLDGRNITSSMFDSQAGPVRDTHLYFAANSKLMAIRQGDWKLFLTASAPIEKGKKGAKKAKSADTSNGPVLYNLATDPGETTDAAGKHPEIVAKLRAEATKREAEIEEHRRPAGQSGIQVLNPKVS